MQTDRVHWSLSVYVIDKPAKYKFKTWIGIDTTQRQICIDIQHASMAHIRFNSKYPINNTWLKDFSYNGVWKKTSFETRVEDKKDRIGIVVEQEVDKKK